MLGRYYYQGVNLTVSSNNAFGSGALLAPNPNCGLRSDFALQASCRHYRERERSSPLLPAPAPDPAMPEAAVSWPSAPSPPLGLPCKPPDRRRIASLLCPAESFPADLTCRWPLQLMVQTASALQAVRPSGQLPRLPPPTTANQGAEFPR